MTQFSEDQLVEQSVIKIIKDLWGDKDCHINAYSDDVDMALGRDNRGEVVLKKYLLPALLKLNPNIPTEVLSQAVELLLRDRSHLSLVQANQEIYRLTRDGVNLPVTHDDGAVTTERIRYLDFSDPSNNHFLCVSQLWIAGEMYTRRPDIILFVNGIPLVSMELKGAHINLAHAYSDHLRDYKTTIPKLFWYNLGVIISNGIETKLGSLTSPFEFFNDWKKIESEDEESKTNLDTAIRGICNKSRLLDIMDNFILYDDSGKETKKILPRYFQYYGVNKAYQRVLDRKQLDGKLGVFWHTQGSGKSYSMVYLSQKVMRHIQGNFTFVIVTDRTQLDGQAYDNFASVRAVYEAEVQAGSITHLKTLLTQDHRQIFTTIQKFQDVEGAISARDDIIVMTDEAHRSQYDIWAQNLRRALPNASFIGFTGTPLMADGEEKTRETFGDYVSVYNFGQSVRDGATVPLFYENRVPNLKNVNGNLEEQLQSIMDHYNLDEDEEGRLECELSTFYEVVTREDRLDTIARDIVHHFVGRGYPGKAMVVSIDKKTAIRMYDKVKKEWEKYLGKLRLDLEHAKDEYQKSQILEKLKEHQDLDMAVVVSLGDNQNELNDMQKYGIDMAPIRSRIQQGKLEDEFKDESSNLKLVFVCAMWLTGFDVPSLSTLYLDKPLKNHTLMQTIARANRVAPGKNSGTIVDYIGVFQNIKRALAIYAGTTQDDDEIIRSKDELISALADQVDQVEQFLLDRTLDLNSLLQANSQEKLIILERFVNKIVEHENDQKQFLALASSINKTYQSVLPDPSAFDYEEAVAAIRTLASRIRVATGQERDLSAAKRDLEDLLDRSIQTGQYLISPHVKVHDLSKLNANALRDYFQQLDNKNLAMQEIVTELKDKITEMVKKNKSRARFMERLDKLLHLYNTGAHDIEQLLQELVNLAHDLTEEEQRTERENLTEEELAIFDILYKTEMSESDKTEVKKVVRELLAKLKDHKFILDWKKKEQGRAGVRSTIEDTLYSSIPINFSSVQDKATISHGIYNYVYEHFDGNQRLYS